MHLFLPRHAALLLKAGFIVTHGVIWSGIIFSDLVLSEVILGVGLRSRFLFSIGQYWINFWLSQYWWCTRYLVSGVWDIRGLFKEESTSGLRGSASHDHRSGITLLLV